MVAPENQNPVPQDELDQRSLLIQTGNGKPVYIGVVSVEEAKKLAAQGISVKEYLKALSGGI